MGQLRRLRVDELAEEGTPATTGSFRPSASTASRRAASSPTSTRRRWTSARSKATRCIPGSRGRTCAKGVVTPNQLEDPDRILYPLKRDRRSAARASGQRVTWDEALDGHRRPHPQGDPGRPARRTDVPRRPARARTATRTACCRRGASTGTTATPTSARRPRDSGTSCGRGADRPSPDYANAKTILLLSSHLETGHYFNPHAQRIIEAQSQGATLITIDPRLSNTSAKANLWLPAYPGTEGALLLAIVRILLDEELLQPRRS